MLIKLGITEEDQITLISNKIEISNTKEMYEVAVESDFDNEVQMVNATRKLLGLNIKRQLPRELSRSFFI